MGHPRPRLEFHRTDDDEVSIRKDGSLIGHIYKHEDVLDSGRHFYLIWLTEDHRGWKKVTDRRVLRAEVDRWIATHRYLG